ncbi:MAG: phosphoglycerate dehydrogenase [Planctomycetota bacterium]
MKILVADKLDIKHFKALEGSGVEPVDRIGITPEELLNEIGDYDALVVRSRTKVTPEVLAAGTKLKVVGRAGSGIDNINLEAATDRGILVMNTPGANSNSAAEHAIAMMMAMCRNVAAADASLRSGKFEKAKFTGVEVKGRRLAVLGLGKIGGLVAQKAIGLGMKVAGYDPMTTAAAASQMGIELVELEDAVGFADIISLHVPLTKQTKHLVNAELMERMKPGVRIINCARGGIIDEDALHQALVKGHVAGAALDVFEVEPPEGSPLLDLPQVVVTPHLGASTIEAQEAVALRVLEQVRDFLTGKATVGAINGLALDEGTRDDIAPFLKLAERLGVILSGIQQGPGKLTARYFGHIPSKNVRALTSYSLKGLLRQFLGDEVNELSSFEKARTRGIEVEEITRDEHKSFQALIEFSLEADGRKTSVAGTVFGKNNLRLVRIDKFNLDAIPEGYMLFVSNDDVPGVIGRIGTALGDTKINIANLSLGRETSGGRSLAVFNLDSAPSADTLKSFEELEGVHVVRLVKTEA